jgi:hypothetical protein
VITEEPVTVPLLPIYLAIMLLFPSNKGALNIHVTVATLLSERTSFLHRVMKGMRLPDFWIAMESTTVPDGLEFWQDTVIVAVTGLFGLTELWLRETDTPQSSEIGELRPSLNVTASAYIIGRAFIYCYSA